MPAGLSPARRALVAAGWAGLLALQLLIARSYLDRGASWHWLLHVPIGLGVGLAVGGLAWAATGRRVPAVACGLLGQLYSIVPDLMFRFLRMPHDPSMDLFLGHIAIHTGPSPVLAALATLLLGGWGWVAAAYRRRVLATALSVAALVLLLVACLLARPLPSRLSDVPRTTAPVGTSR